MVRGNAARPEPRARARAGHRATPTPSARRASSSRRVASRGSRSTSPGAGGPRADGRRPTPALRERAAAAGWARGRTTAPAARPPRPRRWCSDGSWSPGRSGLPATPRRCTSPTGAWCGRVGGCTRHRRIGPVRPRRRERAPRPGGCGTRYRTSGRRPSRGDSGATAPRPVADGRSGPAPDGSSPGRGACRTNTRPARWTDRTSPPSRRACGGWVSPGTGTSRRALSIVPWSFALVRRFVPPTAVSHPPIWACAIFPP